MARQQGQFNQQASQQLNEAELNSAAGGCPCDHLPAVGETIIFIDPNGIEQSMTVNSHNQDGTLNASINKG